MGITCRSNLEIAPHEHEFFELLRFTHLGQEVLSAGDLWEASTLVALGCIESISAGRTIDFAEGASNPIQTAVFEITASNVLRQRLTPNAVQNGKVYVEFLRGGITIGSLQEAALQAPQMMFFLHEADSWDTAVYRFLNEGAGYPESGVLLTFATQEGVVVSGPGGLEHPLSDVPETTKLFPSELRSLSELTEYLLNGVE